MTPPRVTTAALNWRTLGLVGPVMAAPPARYSWRSGWRRVWAGLTEAVASHSRPMNVPRPWRPVLGAALAVGVVLIVFGAFGVFLEGTWPSLGQATFTTTGGGLPTLVAPGKQVADGVIGLAPRQFILVPHLYLSLPGVATDAPLAGTLGALLVSLRRPIVGWRAGFCFALLVPLLPNQAPLGSAELALLVPIFCLAAWHHSRAATWWMFALMLAALWLGSDGLTWGGRVVCTLALSALVVAMDATGASRRARQALAAQSERTELEGARRTVLEERARIARELHDVVAHHMSLIAVQTETAPFRLHDLSASALAELGSVNQQARLALADMRRLLGVLRNDAPPERAPQPQLSDVQDLVAATRRAGVTVDLSLPEDGLAVPPGTGLCAYRIVQEALANATRHAPGSAVRVQVEHEPGALCLRVTNGPSAGPRGGPPPLDGAKPGHGLVGMRERVSMLRGSLIAEAAPDGGFTVMASLPLERALSHHGR